MNLARSSANFRHVHEFARVIVVAVHDERNLAAVAPDRFTTVEKGVQTRDRKFGSPASTSAPRDHQHTARRWP